MENPERTNRLFCRTVMSGLFVCLFLMSHSAFGELWNIDTGLSLEYFEYREPGLMKETGPQTGVFVSAFYRPGNWFWCLFGDWKSGELRYNGGNASGTRTFKFDTPNTIYNLRLEGGRFVTLSDSRLSPYLGIGGRLLLNDLPDQDVIKGYNREQTYIYVPLGVRWETQQAGLRIDYVFEYDLFIKGYNRSLGSEITQDSGFGLRASVRVVSLPLDTLWFSDSIKQNALSRKNGKGRHNIISYKPYSGVAVQVPVLPPSSQVPVIVPLALAVPVRFKSGSTMRTA